MNKKIKIKNGETQVLLCIVHCWHILIGLDSMNILGFKLIYTTTYFLDIKKLLPVVHSGQVLTPNLKVVPMPE